MNSEIDTLSAANDATVERPRRQTDKNLTLIASVCDVLDCPYYARQTLKNNIEMRHPGRQLERPLD
jgi:hypothetical protein